MQQSFGGIIIGKPGIPVIPQTSQKRGKKWGRGSEAVCHPTIGSETLQLYCKEFAEQSRTSMYFLSFFKLWGAGSKPAEVKMSQFVIVSGPICGLAYSEISIRFRQAFCSHICHICLKQQQQEEAVKRQVQWGRTLTCTSLTVTQVQMWVLRPTRTLTNGLSELISAFTAVRGQTTHAASCSTEGFEWNGSFRMLTQLKQWCVSTRLLDLWVSFLGSAIGPRNLLWRPNV